MVALAILAIALAAAVKGTTNYTANATYLRDRTMAHWVAMNRIVEYQLRKEWPATGRQEGTDTMGGLEWYWRAVVAETPDRDLRRLEVEVRQNKKDEEALDHLVAFLGRPR